MNHDIVMSAKILWNYLRLDESARSAELLLVLGSIDDRVAGYAAELSRRYDYDTVIFTGGAAHANDILATKRQEATEAEWFSRVYKNAGGDMSNVLLEKSAQHTGENATMTYALLRALNLPVPVTVQILTKPYMERRARAAFEAQWPGKSTTFFITSPPLSFQNYFTAEQPFEKVVNIMVGDYERIREYPKRQLQTEQAPDERAEEAYEALIAAGYDKHVLKNNNVEQKST